MDIQSVMRAGAVAASLAAGLAAAQTPEPSVIWSPAVINDVTPLPAEERDSMGAIVLQDSMVPAQRQAFAAHRTALRVADVARGAERAQRSAETREALKQQRTQETLRLNEMGAGSLEPR